MANVYYKIDGDRVYYTNEHKSGYTLRDQYDHEITNSRYVTVELYNDKFELPANSSYLFYCASNNTFNDTDKWDISNVTNMNYCFHKCNLTSIDVSNWDTSNVTNMSALFVSCTALTSIDLSNWDTSKVMYMADIFNNCSSLTSVDLSGWDTSNVIYTSFLFDDCSSLTSVNLSSFNTSKVKYMECMFRNCVNLEHIYVGANWNTEAVTESRSMFENCTRLHNFNPDYIDKTYAILDDGLNSGYLEEIPIWRRYDLYIKENNIWKLAEVYG